RRSKPAGGGGSLRGTAHARRGKRNSRFVKGRSTIPFRNTAFTLDVSRRCVAASHLRDEARANEGARNAPHTQHPLRSPGGGLAEWGWDSRVRVETPV